MLFTKEQIQLFASNPYTAYVSESVISYTAEFKEFFVESLKEGMSARQIFEAAGYDPKILGNSRIKTFTCRIRKQADLGQEFRSGRKAYMLAARQNDSVRRHGCIRALHMISKRNLHPTKIREEPYSIHLCCKDHGKRIG